MGDEAGQPLSNIIIRKEMERKLGKGLFMWGIGNAIGQGIEVLLGRVKNPKVIFSKMKSKAKLIDNSPSKVFLWYSYVDRFGEIIPIPDHIFLTSRALSGRKIKQKHYALVCRKNDEIGQEKWQPIKFSAYKNIDSGKEKVGFSQVSAIVERNGGSNGIDIEYPVMFSAGLVSPYFVTLIHPVELPLKILDELNALLISPGLSCAEWGEWVLSTKKTIVQNVIQLKFLLIN